MVLAAQRPEEACEDAHGGEALPVPAVRLLGRCQGQSEAAFGQSARGSGPQLVDVYFAELYVAKYLLINISIIKRLFCGTVFLRIIY